MKRYYWLLTFLVVFLACNPAKKYVKKGLQYAVEGNHDAAANYFYNALLVQQENAEAKDGLNKSGNIVLQNKFTEFSKYVVAHQDKEAIFQYLACRKYYQKCKSVGVDLMWPTLYDPIYDDLKTEYVGKRYDEGIGYMKENQFDRAEGIFTEISQIDSTYKDATVLRTKSIAEPLYQHGMKMMQTENYKEAYRDFSKIVTLDASYKNSKVMKDEALAKASVGLGVLPVQNQTRIQGFDVRLYQQIVATLVKSNNPFLKVVDRSSLEGMLREQQLGMSGMVDPESAAKAGKLIGLKYVLMTAISDLVYEDNGEKMDSVVAYEAYTETLPPAIPNGIPQSVTRFKKVYYADLHQKRRLYYRVFYQLVSTQTAQVVASEVLSEEAYDEMHYCTYAGNVSALYPELPKNNTMPARPTEFREQFNQVKRALTSKEDMTQNVCKVISQKIMDDINIYLDK